MPLTLDHLEISVEIDRPIEEVIAFVDDCRNDPIWQASVLDSVQKTEGEPKEGSIYHMKEKFLGRVIEQDWIVTKRNPDGSYWAAKSTTGPFPMETSMRFEATANGTRVTRTLHVEVGRFFKVATPVVGHIAKRELEMDFVNLKELLEAGI